MRSPLIGTVLILLGQATLLQTLVLDRAVGSRSDGTNLPSIVAPLFLSQYDDFDMPQTTYKDAFYEMTVSVGTPGKDFCSRLVLTAFLNAHVLTRRYYSA